MPKKLFLAILISVMLLLTTACSLTKSGDVPPQDPGAAVTVDNRNWTDMNIYIVNNGFRTRLGRVTGMSRKLLAIPADAMVGSGTLRFLADPVGRTGQPISNEITVRPGEELLLIINP